MNAHLQRQWCPGMGCLLRCSSPSAMRDYACMVLLEWQHPNIHACAYVRPPVEMLQRVTFSMRSACGGSLHASDRAHEEETRAPRMRQRPWPVTGGSACTITVHVYCGPAGPSLPRSNLCQSVLHDISGASHISEINTGFTLLPHAYVSPSLFMFSVHEERSIAMSGPEHCWAQYR